MSVTWRRIRAGSYRASSGHRVEQFQGDLYPRWGIWFPGKDPIDDPHDLYADTLREGKAMVAREVSP